MLRKYESGLSAWLKQTNRKPLIVRGARQVGKSTLVRNFAEKQGLRLIELNLEKEKRLEPVFARLDIQEIILEIELVCNKGSLKHPGILLFLDEIQATPSALAALRYFCEERPELPVISAGSLLEFSLSEHSFSMPVGRVEYFHIGPVTFLEYAQAAGNDQLVSYLREYRIGAEFSASAHEKALSLLRTYLLTGGMPQAAAAYIGNRDVEEVNRIHHSIIDTFRDDFGKYASGAKLSRIQRVFDFIPTSLGRKFKSTQIDRDWKAADVREAFDLLAKARVCMPAFHTPCSGVPIDGLRNEKIFKPFFLDVGLANTTCGIRGVNAQAFQETHFINEGSMAEQFAAQHLDYAHGPSARPSLFYWLRESSTSNAEVDFVMQVGTRIVPIEVKSAKAGALRSVHQMVVEKGLELAVRFDLNPPSAQKVRTHLTDGSKNTAEFTLVSLPLYLAERTAELICWPLVIDAGQGI
jgi:hypothetical protein